MSHASQLQRRRIANLQRLRTQRADTRLLTARAAQQSPLGGDGFGLQPLEQSRMERLADAITSRHIGAGRLWDPFANSAPADRQTWEQECVALTGASRRQRNSKRIAQFLRDFRAFLRFAHAFHSTNGRTPSRAEIYDWMTYHPETSTVVEPAHLALYRRHAAALYRRCHTHDADAIEVIAQEDPTDHESWLYLHPRAATRHDWYNYAGYPTFDRFYLTLHPAFAAQAAASLIGRIAREGWDIDLKLPYPFTSDDALSNHLGRPDKIVLYCPHAHGWDLRQALGELWKSLRPAFVREQRPVRFAEAVSVYNTRLGTHTHTRGIYTAPEAPLYDQRGHPLTSFHGLHAMLLAHLLEQRGAIAPRSQAVTPFYEAFRSRLNRCILGRESSALRDAIDATTRDSPKAQWEDIFPTKMFPA